MNSLKKQLIKQLDCEEGDAVHIIRLSRNGKGTQRIGVNFTGAELVAILEWCKIDIIQMLTKGEFNPKSVSILKEDEHE